MEDPQCALAAVCVLVREPGPVVLLMYCRVEFVTIRSGHTVIQVCCCSQVAIVSWAVSVSSIGRIACAQ
eukprot:scaffold156439_cov19-Tisochrysis_lutea.AAC.1